MRHLPKVADAEMTVGRPWRGRWAVVATALWGMALGVMAPPWSGLRAGPARGGGSAADRAGRLVGAMTLDEKIALVHTRFGTPTGGKPAPPHALLSAGVGEGVPRLGIPPLEETDAGLGIADPANIHFGATAMPSGLATGATFDTVLAERAGAAIGAEARDRGFGVVLGGGADLIREPRGGRNFEYVSEDPLLTGLMAGASIAGVQSQRLVSTMKHFALNDQENGRVVYSADLAPAAARESDLLAFELALEIGRPGAVMAAYNRVNGVFASQNPHLLTQVLKDDWGFDGWVLSDWGGTHSTIAAALAGLDQESGQENDPQVFFGDPLRRAVLAGWVPRARLDDMVRRQLFSRLRLGVFDDPPRQGAIRDGAAHAEVAQRAAEEGIVLLRNRSGLLPLAASVRSIAVVGRMADKGVLSGGGSSQVVPDGAIRAGGEPKAMFYGQPRVYDPSPPLAALRARFPHAAVTFNDGADRAAAATAARQADVAIVVAEQWSNESLDHATLCLPDGQDGMIEAVADANPRTVVVLETGDPVTMPWLDRVSAVLEAWYPGQRGGEAIAAVLSGQIDPSGRLPLTFPRDVAQLPRPLLPDHATTANNPGETAKGGPLVLDYNVEGADVGYRWFLKTGQVPLFPFGFGLTYTRFVTDDVAASLRDGQVTVTFEVTNAGSRAGAEVAQVYADAPGSVRRLVGWRRVELRPGEKRRLEVSVDPRLLARFDAAAQAWDVVKGVYRFAVRSDATAEGPGTSLALDGARWPVRHGACGGVPCGGAWGRDRQAVLPHSP